MVAAAKAIEVQKKRRKR